MAAPPAGNEQPWEFIVVDDKNVLKRIADVHPYAKMLYEAPVAIVVCGDLNKEKYKGFWVQDCSAATQNILLEATDKGLGAVWIGVYPDDTRVKDISNIFGIPSNVIPLSIVAVGYPAQEMQEVDRFDPQKYIIISGKGPNFWAFFI
ncbi:nitroreductase family protein [Caloramator sp. Dgby_cultured_2]|uniref:nitroreductase family protein n=1 Tax=Caloramator sp. Dgby_cultured_2 TaxID=3029174 RepID=UPI00315880B0